MPETALIDAPISIGVVMPPTQKDLPCDDDVPMETQRHKLQMDILIETLYPWLEQRDNGYVGGNMFLYFSLEQARNQDFRGPDMFVVLDVPKGERLSWVVWEEGKAPNVVIELLSPSTSHKDKHEKRLVYQNQVRVPEYFWFDPFNANDLVGFSLQHGTYQVLTPDVQDRLISQQLNLALVTWRGGYCGVETIWLRWQTLDGTMLPTTQEQVETRKLEAEQAQAETQQAQAQAQQAEIKAQQAQAEIQDVQKRSQDLENLLSQYRDRFGEI